MEAILLIEINPGLLVVLAFMILIMLRAPVFVALGFPPLAYLIIYDFPIVFVSQRLVRTLNSFTLLAIPLFIFVGALMNHGKITDKIFAFSNNIVGHFQGGLAQVNIVTSLIFSGISGSALADIGGVGRILIKAMEQEDYDSGFAAALTSASATVGPIFPPSIPLIIFGLVAQVSVLSLLLAGILPALLATAVLMVGTLLIARWQGLPRHNDQASFSTILDSFTDALPALMTPVVLLVGMFVGIFGPTEAAAATVAYIILVNVFWYRIRQLKYIWTAGLETVKTTGTIIVILASAGLFSWVISAENVDAIFASFIFSFSQNPLVVLLLVNVLLIILGLFLEPIAAMIMSIPIVVPPLVDLGLDPVHVGVIVVFNLMIGLLTPPLGLSIFLSAEIAETEVQDVISEIKVYYVMLLIVLALITYVPALTLALPDLAL
ncbi:TRAP-type transport system large permease protein (plasmid) [Haloferax gibbonsii]|uniref:TRAP-type transport system large permease protein n=1 Tax=Haloferax gibbonsii TaxID=35746 RepID=A0A871BL97_HALGI|nr:TRAP transporter large permease [Haloferax gibbonsii]QOS13576.1 TRAP-type transport system large permease protein [Haloferax gibbonsii]